MAQAKTGDTVKIHFTSKLEDGTFFDTSEGKEPLEFVVGEHQVMQGLEDAVIGMTRGESKSVTIPPDKAFGAYLEDKVHKVARDQFPMALDPVAGMQFEIKQEDGKTTIVRVTEVSDSQVTLDTNHPLAGKSFLFDIRLFDIEPSQIDRNAADEYYKKGIELQDKGQIDEAISCYHKAIERNRDHSGAYYNLGVAFQEKEMIDQAILYYEIAIGLNQEFTDAHHNLGVAFKEKGLFDDALICFRRVLQLKPDHVDAYYNFGNVLVAKGQFDEAIQYYQKAVELKPDYAEAHWNIALINLLLGNFEKGWKGYEWRWKLEGISIKRDFSQPLWEGSDISGRTILLHAEQGFGDTIQFVRYAPSVAQRGAKVIVECQKELIPLVKCVSGVSQVIMRGESLPHFDLHCPLLSLPSIFKSTLQSIPVDIPYFTVDPRLINKWRDKIYHNEEKIRVGLAWSGDPTFKTDQIRSCSLKDFSLLSQSANTVFYSLQKGKASDDARNPPEGMKLIDYTDDVNDFSDTASFIQNLDLIISVDTSVAHLAGALGKPVWTLLPFVPDWRWMLNRDDSPWYPTMKLFRQPSPGDWQSVIKSIKKTLDNFLKQ